MVIVDSCKNTGRVKEYCNMIILVLLIDHGLLNIEREVDVTVVEG